MNKCLVLFVEGDTEVEFYKQVIAHARKLHSKGYFDTNIEYRNVKGVGGFKNIALRKFVKDIKQKYGLNCKYTIVLCRDTDVFEFSPRPPVRWDEVEKEMLANGADSVIHVKAIHSIEDWFLCDTTGILKFLRLNKNTKVSGKNGYEKLQRLYKSSNKVYIKGMKSNGMINRLDIDKISSDVRDQLEPLYKALGIDKTK